MMYAIPHPAVIRERREIERRLDEMAAENESDRLEYERTRRLIAKQCRSMERALEHVARRKPLITDLGRLAQLEQLEEGVRRDLQEKLDVIAESDAFFRAPRATRSMTSLCDVCQEGEARLTVQGSEDGEPGSFDIRFCKRCAEAHRVRSTGKVGAT